MPLARALFALAMLLVVVPTPALADDSQKRIDNELLKKPGHFALMRHAWAPFDGAPKGVEPKAEDCATQRNLDDFGRRQAREVGERLRAAGVTFDEVYTSPVCRCQDTADLITGRKVAVLPAIDSFFRKAKALEAERLAALRAHLYALPPEARGLYVTHGSYIQAVTGDQVGETVIVVIKRDGKGGFEKVGMGLP